MLLSQIEKLNKISLKMLQEEEELNEAYHKDDRTVLQEMRDKMNHHSMMQDRHRLVMNGAKDKDMTKHDNAIMCHSFACKHYANMGGNSYSEYGMNGLPQDYHMDKDFYNKVNKMISDRADSRSKECGVNCEK